MFWRPAAPALAIVCSLSLSAQAQHGQPPADSSRQQIEAQALYLRGLTRLYLEQLDEALKWLQQAHALQPNDPSVLLSLADVHLAQGDIQAATYFAEQAHRRDNSAQSAIRLAQLYEVQDRLPDAERLAGVAVGRAPDWVAAQLTHARLLGRNKKHGEAGRTLTVALESLRAERNLQRTTSLLQEHFDDADQHELLQTLLESLVAGQPSQGVYAVLLARHLARHGEPESAIAVLESANDRNPSLFVAAQLELLRVDATGVEVRDTLPAISDPTERLRQALARQPEDAQIHVDLAQALLQAGHVQEAANLFTTAASLDPTLHDVWVMASRAWTQAGEPAIAFEAAEDGLIIFSGSVELAVEAVSSLVSMGKTDVARHRIDALVSLAGEVGADSASLARIDGLRAWLAEISGASLEADRLIEAAFENSAAAPEVKALHARILSSRGRYDDAGDLLDQVVADRPHHLGYRVQRVRIYLDQQRYDEAANIVAPLATGEGSPPSTILELYGDALEGLGDTANARAFWQKALERDPTNERIRSKIG